MYYTNNEDYLAHHGIKGQKWGIRRYQNSDGTLTEEGKKRYSVGEGRKFKESSNETKYGMDPLLATLAAYTAAYAVAAATIAVPVAVEDVSAKSKAKKYKKERDEAKETDPKTGFKLKDNKEMSDKDDLKRINPMVKAINSEGYTNNCMLCTTTYDMRKRGYDVTVNKTDDGFATSKVKDWYPKAKIVDISPKDEYGNTSYERMCKDAISELSKQPEGARGNLMVSWAGGFSGHSMIYQIKDGKLQILDGQTNEIYKNPETIINKNRIRSVSYARLDNVDFDPKRIKGACIS